MSKRLTRAQAVRDAQTIWGPVAEGKYADKGEALKHQPELALKYEYHGGCPFCAYDGQIDDDCEHCPYRRQFHTYCSLGRFSYDGHPKAFAKRVMQLKP